MKNTVKWLFIEVFENYIKTYLCSFILSFYVHFIHEQKKENEMNKCDMLKNAPPCFRLNTIWTESKYIMLETHKQNISVEEHTIFSQRFKLYELWTCDFVCNKKSRELFGK